jgi:uncharacterized protein YjbI with pentapeptide repeats
LSNVLLAGETAADLREANLSGADLSSADLERITDVTDEKLEQQAAPL